MKGPLLAAALLVVTGCTGASDDPGPAGTRVPSAADVSSGARALRSCGSPAQPVPSLPLPEGVVAARLCGRTSNFSWRAPRRVLTEQVEDLVRLIDVQPPLEAGWGCQRGGGVSYDLRLAYSDGSVLSLPGDTACQTLIVAGTPHEGASLVAEQFLAGLRAQRDAVSAP